MVALAALLLAACDQQGAPVQTVELSDNPGVGPQVMVQSPDTSQAQWQTPIDIDHDHEIPGASVMVLDYGTEGQPPLLTLLCDPVAPAKLTIVRHAPALPGQTALFPVIGNGERSRFPVDASEVHGEWRWQATLPASDPRWTVFSGSRQLLATLPGAGMLDIAGSRLPGAFVAWCREEIATLPASEADLAPPDELRPDPNARYLQRARQHAQARSSAPEPLN